MKQKVVSVKYSISKAIVRAHIGHDVKINWCLKLHTALRLILFVTKKSTFSHKCFMSTS